METRTIDSDAAEIQFDPNEERAAGSVPSKLVGFAARYYDGTAGTQFQLWPGGPVERIMPGAF